MPELRIPVHRLYLLATVLCLLLPGSARADVDRCAICGAFFGDKVYIVRADKTTDAAIIMKIGASASRASAATPRSKPALSMR